MTRVGLGWVGLGWDRLFWFFCFVVRLPSRVVFMFVSIALPSLLDDRDFVRLDSHCQKLQKRKKWVYYSSSLV